MKQLNIITLIFILVASVAACGNGEETPAPAEQSTNDDGDDVRTIEIIGIDDMRYVVAEESDGLVTAGQIGEEYELSQILASPGEEIRIILQTRSQLPGTAMSHNLVLLELGTDADAFANQSITASDNEYISPDLENQVIVATAMLAGGESDTIQFTVPEETGVYDYLCSFPGHYVSGMVGELVVE